MPYSDFAAIGAGFLMYLVTLITNETGMSNRAVLVAGTIIAGSLYSIFTAFVPAVTQADIVKFATESLSSSWAIYNLIHRPIVGSTPAATTSSTSI